MHNFFNVESNLYSLNANYIYELVFKSVASEYMRKNVNPPQMRYYACIVMNNKGRQLFDILDGTTLESSNFVLTGNYIIPHKDGHIRLDNGKIVIPFYPDFSSYTNTLNRNMFVYEALSKDYIGLTHRMCKYLPLNFMKDLRPFILS